MACVIQCNKPFSNPDPNPRPTTNPVLTQLIVRVGVRESVRAFRTEVRAGVIMVSFMMKVAIGLQMEMQFISGLLLGK